ncbi:hypothetical protein JYU34_012692 [Plutella xylostella]|uniref:Targeting protein for Xklp2 n=1 Tax=Plutella xylostella TaxID=51655 RepID=A0ABQ7QBY3_PLUXY|nr:hypothetical protein JYU34_012692 [Plutella xylostella]
MEKRNVTNFRGESLTPNYKFHIKDEPVTPNNEEFGEHNNFDYSFDSDCGDMKKSLSMSDIAAIREDLMNLELQGNKEEVYHRYRRSTAHSHDQPQALSRTKFVSMAEAIYHFQRDTPGRFHSTRPSIFQAQGHAARLELTVPQSPMLLCKQRSRPLHIVSQKEKEEMEIEEIRKHKIKANPVPKSVIEGPHLPEVPKRPLTLLEPFNLTEIPKKIQSPEPVIKFKARQAPKHILEKPQIPAKPPVHVTKPLTPKFHYKPLQEQMQAFRNRQAKPVEKPVQKPVQRHGPIRPEPFSFEKRDEELKRLKEERIKRQIEEEKKQASQFKAHPLPGVVRKVMMKTAAKGCSSNASSENKENFKFEARPPVVLYKEPFKPVLKPIQIVKPTPFALTTEKRAAEREKFDKNLKEKEEEQEKLRQQKEREAKEIEEKQMAAIRAKLVHHPKPLHVAEPFLPQKSEMPLTVPETPKFIRRLKQQ